MRIKTPVGDYEYRVTALHLRGGRLEIDGSLGMWETTTVLRPREWVPPVAVVLGTLAVGLAALNRQAGG
jgi:hypothetical protein